MQIKWLGGENFEIKSKQAMILVGDKKKINDFEIKMPGEYEIAGVFWESDGEISAIDIEGMRLVHLDNFNRFLSEKETEEIGDVDILLVPVGGGETLDSKKAVEVINQIEPKIVIPMCFEDAGNFLGQLGLNVSPQDEIKITPKDLPQEEQKVVILNAKNA